MDSEVFVSNVDMSRYAILYIPFGWLRVLQLPCLVSCVCVREFVPSAPSVLFRFFFVILWDRLPIFFHCCQKLNGLL